MAPAVEAAEHAFQSTGVLFDVNKREFAPKGIRGHARYSVSILVRRLPAGMATLKFGRNYVVWLELHLSE